MRYAQSLPAVLAYVEELERFALDKLSVHARSGRGDLFTRPAGTFDLRILPSGAARLATTLGACETVRTFSLDAGVWSNLQAHLVALVAGQVRLVGKQEGYDFTRKLAIRTSTGSLTFAQPRDWAPPLNWAREPDFAASFADALRAWALVDAEIDCPGCDDYAAADELLLQELR